MDECREYVRKSGYTPKCTPDKVAETIYLYGANEVEENPEFSQSVENFVEASGGIKEFDF